MSCCLVASIVHNYSAAGSSVKLFTQLLLPAQLIEHSRPFQMMLQKACSLLFKAEKWLQIFFMSDLHACDSGTLTVTRF
jgi:hypothetical protein